MFGHPAFVSAHCGSYAQRKALFAQQGIAAVPGTNTHNQAFFREMDNIRVFRIARPSNVFFTFGERLAYRVHARNEFAVGAENVENLRGNARHYAHVYDYIRRVGNFNADLRDWSADRTHAERNYVHCTALHASFEKSIEFLFHLGRIHPVVCWAGVSLSLGAYERAGFYAGNVARIRTEVIATGALLLIEFCAVADSLFNHHVEKLVRFFLRTVAPINAVGRGESGNLVHPGEQSLILYCFRIYHFIYSPLFV